MKDYYAQLKKKEDELKKKENLLKDKEEDLNRRLKEVERREKDLGIVGSGEGGTPVVRAAPKGFEPNFACKTIDVAGPSNSSSSTELGLGPPSLSAAPLPSQPTETRETPTSCQIPTVSEPRMETRPDREKATQPPLYKALDNKAEPSYRQGSRERAAIHEYRHANPKTYLRKEYKPTEGASRNPSEGANPTLGAQVGSRAGTIGLRNKPPKTADTSLKEEHSDQIRDRRGDFDYLKAAHYRNNSN